jgi:type II secretory pathway component GspD/PulD (secretin)
VPLLGSLPLIGHLFKRNNVIINSQELLFFLTPRIIPG